MNLKASSEPEPRHATDLISESLFSKNGTSSEGKSDGAGGGPGGQQQPRPSQYARLIPREAMRPPPTGVDDGGGGGDRGGARSKKKKKHRGSDGSDSAKRNDRVAKAKDGDSTDENHSEGESVRVYRMDGATSQLELLPEEDYDLVHHSDDEDDGGQGQSNDEKKNVADGENGMKYGDKREDDVDNSKAEDDAMVVDEKEDDASSAREKDLTANGDGELLHDSDMIYTAKAPAPSLLPTSSHLQSRQERNGNASSSSHSGDVFDDAEVGDDDGLVVRPRPQQRPDPLFNEVSAAASTLARALASRTEGFEKLSPGDSSLFREKTGEEKKSEEEKKEKEKKNTKLSWSAAPPPPPSGSKGNEESKRPAKAKEGENAKNDESDENKKNGEQPSVAFLQSRKLISSLPPTANVLDGDSPQTLLRLSKLRRWQESHVEPCMQGVELDNWEDGIDWEGDGVSGDEDDKERKEGSPSKMEADEKGNDFEPPEPGGGRHPKRARRAAPGHHEDPVRLLLEPCDLRLEAPDLAEAVDWDGARGADDDADEEEEVDVPLILQSSVAGRSVASLLAPRGGRLPPFESRRSYRARRDREAASDVAADLAGPGIGMHGENAEKVEEARRRKREQREKDKQSRITKATSALGIVAGTGRRITSSLMGPGGAERTARPSRHALGGDSSAHDAEYVEQLELVRNHALVTPDLTLSECRQFHRPRLPLIVVNPSCPWQFQTRVITEKKRGWRGGGVKGAATNAYGSTIVGSYHAMMSAGSKAENKIRNEADLSPTIGDLVVMEYSEERPPLFMTKGMTCRIVNYYRGDRSRCPISGGGGDRPLRKRHGNKAASAAPNNTPGAAVGPSNRVERPPRLVGPNQYAIKSATDLIGISPLKTKKNSEEAAALEAKKAKENAIDVLPEGVTEILHQKVHGPFIGEVGEGETRTGLISNLFAAPVFRHEPEPTDFLMILGQVKAKSKSSINETATGGLGVVLRPLPPNIYCVGQTEPRLKVFAPNANDKKKFVNAFFPYQVSKNIERAEMREGRGLTFDDIKDRLFANTTIPDSQLRSSIKQVANFERSNNRIWSLKALGEDSFPGVEALGRKVAPEGVAAYESQCAAIRRLQDLGVKEPHSGRGNTVVNVASVIMFLNGAVQAAKEQRLKMEKVLEMKKRQKSSQLVYFEKAFEKLDAEYKEVKTRQEIAKFIYEELQLSPWNISGEFIDVHKRGLGGAMMELTGIGYPSGIEEAYSFLRETDGRSNKVSQSNSDGAPNAQSKKITGTRDDLRKLTMEQMASKLHSYGMEDKEIRKLERWDRVHMIRFFAGMGDERGQFARREKLRLIDQMQNYKKRIEEIWQRQIKALTTDAGNEVAAGSDMDDDDFADELERGLSNSVEVNGLMNARRRGNGDDTHTGAMRGLDTQELSKDDAREFAALRRQREEERAMQRECLDRNSSVLRIDERPKRKFKVVQRRITKTRSDGTHTVTFEFIVNRKKVDEIVLKKKQQEADEKKRHAQKKKKKKVGNDSQDDQEGTTCVGHAMFDNEGYAKKRKLKHSQAQAQESRKKKPMKKT